MGRGQHGVGDDEREHSPDSQYKERSREVPPGVHEVRGKPALLRSLPERPPAVLEPGACGEVCRDATLTLVPFRDYVLARVVPEAAMACCRGLRVGRGVVVEPEPRAGSRFHQGGPGRRPGQRASVFSHLRTATLAQAEICGDDDISASAIGRRYRGECRLAIGSVAEKCSIGWPAHRLPGPHGPDLLS